jgi:hypothetical protein
MGIMIDKKWLELISMEEMTWYKKVFGDTRDTEIGFYDTFLIHTDKKVMQYTRELALNLTTIFTKEEYLELEKARQFAFVEQNRIASELK